MVARAASRVWRAWRTWIECVKIRLMNIAASVLAMTERETTQAAADSMPNIALGDISSNADVVGPEGLEPSTRGLKVRCSAN